MEVELFLHGVPNGEDFWGKDEERNYFGTFYDNSTDEVKFLIQIRTLKGKTFCYYNYLVYRSVGSPIPNVVANDGRDGSYFGLSLRFDAYCRDVANMYRILDTVYNTYVLGNILKNEKSKLRYTTPYFSSITGTIDVIEKNTLQLIQNAFSAESFLKLDGFSTGGSNYPSRNLFDCTQESVLESVKKYGKIALSPYYPNTKEATIIQDCNSKITATQQQCEAKVKYVQQQCDSQVTAIQQQYDAKLKAESEKRIKEKNEYNASLASSQKQISQLQKDLSQKETTVKQLNNKVINLESELEKYGQNKKIAQIVAPIEKPISELANVLKEVVPDERKKQKKHYLNSVRLLFVIINFLLLLFLAFQMQSSLNHSKDKTENKTETFVSAKGKKQKEETTSRKDKTKENETIQLRKENQELKETINKQKKEIEEFQKSFDEKKEAIYNVFNPIITIDIVNYSGRGSMRKKIEYTVEAKNGLTSGVSWQVKGATWKKTDSLNKITVTPTDESVEISYFFAGILLKNRELNAE